MYAHQEYNVWLEDLIFLLFFTVCWKQNYAVSKGLKLKPSPSGKENPKPKEMKKEKVTIKYMHEPLKFLIVGISFHSEF